MPSDPEPFQPIFHYDYPDEPPMDEEGALDRELTEAIELKDAVVITKALPDEHAVGIEVSVTFGALLKVDDKLVEDDAGMSYDLALGVLRDGFLQSLLDYLQEHDSRALKSTIERAEYETQQRWAEWGRG